jgi:hypothetical protein
MENKMDLKKYGDIPVRTIDALTRYKEEGLAPGGFLEAIIKHNLPLARKLADEQNTIAFRQIVAYVLNELPAIAQGSDVRYRAWISIQGMKGVEKRKQAFGQTIHY